MNDRDFLDYVRLHSQTERELFHVDHVERLWRLAGWERPRIHGEFVAMHAENIVDVLADAYANICEAGGE